MMHKHPGGQCNHGFMPPPPPPPPSFPYTHNNHDHCDCCNHMVPPQVPDSYPSAGQMVENGFMLINTLPFLYDNTKVQYGQKLCVGENVYTRVSQRRDPSCINLSATFDMTDDIITNTVLNHYLEQFISTNSESLKGILPVIRNNVTFTLHYTIYDANGGVVHESSKSTNSADMKYHSTDIRDYYLNSCKNIITANIPMLDFQGMYTLTLDTITASVNVINVIEHISEGLNPYYQFTDNNTKIAIQHDTIMNDPDSDGSLLIASCPINQSFMFQSNITTRMKLSFTAFMSNLISTQNVFNIWELLNGENIDTSELQKQIDQLSTTVEDLKNTVDDLQNEIEELKKNGGSSEGEGTPTDTYSKQQIDDILKNYVKSEDGKGLSTNDYTNDDRDYLHKLMKSEQIVFADSHLEFPNVGSENIVYISKSEKMSYVWDNVTQTYHTLNKNNIELEYIQSIVDDIITDNEGG